MLGRSLQLILPRRRLGKRCVGKDGERTRPWTAEMEKPNAAKFHRNWRQRGVHLRQENSGMPFLDDKVKDSSSRVDTQPRVARITPDVAE